MLSASWDQFDLERGFWTKPSHHTKQKKIEHTPLSDAALQLLQRMHATRTSAAVFPGQSGAGTGQAQEVFNDLEAGGAHP